MYSNLHGYSYENVNFMTLGSLIHKRSEYVYAAFRELFALIEVRREPVARNLAKMYYGRPGPQYIYTCL